MHELRAAYPSPKEIVEALDRHIIGQNEAKRAVAVALRNRYRRKLISDEMRDEVTPKNILMTGPTGVGKTEIARRLARLVKAPFLKVEATKFTEVGYVGRDVESIIRDLAETSICMVKNEMYADVEHEAAAAAEARLVDILAGNVKRAPNPLETLLGVKPKEQNDSAYGGEELESRRALLKEKLMRGELESRLIEIEVDERSYSDSLPGTDLNVQDMLGTIMPKKKKLRRLTVNEARGILTNEEADKLIDEDAAVNMGLKRAEQDGIVFIDEIDKIAGSSASFSGPDVSREGVQRDILPIIEGTTVNTKYGLLRTDHMLFIAAGAFHVSKVTDLIPELQGRFPVSVALSSLTQEDFLNILTQPENALIKQYQALLKVEGITLSFTQDALTEIARTAYLVNQTGENIGARRLHTIMERLLEDISFNAGSMDAEAEVTLEENYVKQNLGELLKERNLDKYII